jgi:predicted glycogen debranching enzyme
VSPSNVTQEWLEADGLGGFASGTTATIRTRRYHALLLAAATPPTGRFVLVNGLEAWLDTPAGSFALSTHCYAPHATHHPNGVERIESFTPIPWPTWTYSLPGGTILRHELFVPRGQPTTVLTWRRVGSEPASIRLRVRLLFSGRDYHHLQKENATFRFQPEQTSEGLRWHPYPGVPGVLLRTNGTYRHDPVWFRRFHYRAEQERGLDCEEDLASPGWLTWDLASEEAICILHAGLALPAGDVIAFARELESSECRRRERLGSRLERAAEDYLVKRGDGLTVVAGYPWFTDWGRDTFISLRGLCLATGRWRDAWKILLAWAGAVSAGMLPNRFLDAGDRPEYNSVDASLWYVVAVGACLDALDAAGQSFDPEEEQVIRRAVETILAGYTLGTRFGIRLEADGLLAAGEAGVALTWMDARIGDWAVTPRVGKPVEVQALWLNALLVASRWSRQWIEPFWRGATAFRQRFWNGERRLLYDVVDVNHREGVHDGSFRPNQVFALGGLPVQLIETERARQALAAIEEHLWTPLGLRSLAPGEPGYVRRYQGGVPERDGAYHQGTVWPWLLGPFVEAWVRLRGNTDEARQQARVRFLEPLLHQLDRAGLGHLPEIADAEYPYAPRGCPFQAWSVAEALRLDRVVLAGTTQGNGRTLSR